MIKSERNETSSALDWGGNNNKRLSFCMLLRIFLEFGDSRSKAEIYKICFKKRKKI